MTCLTIGCGSYYSIRKLHNNYIYNFIIITSAGCGVPAFRCRLWNRDGGLAVVSLQLHLHCDGLLILLTQAFLLGPKDKHTNKQTHIKHMHRGNETCVRFTCGHILATVRMGLLIHTPTSRLTSPLPSHHTLQCVML